VLATAGLVTACAAAAAATTPPGGPVTLVDPRITESSGLAASRRHPGTVWTTNDSGDGARLFAVDADTGATVGVHRYGAPVRDVEALAVTRTGRVLVGDIGDNSASRELVRVFWFDEPALGETSGTWASWELDYPDGPHDAEALASDPTSDRVVVVTKGATGGIYALPDTPSRQGVNRLERVGTVDARVTDATYLPDGSALVVRTYASLLVLDPVTWAVQATARLPVQPQGETVTVLGDSLLVGSEGSGSQLVPVTVPARSTTQPTPSASAAPTTGTPTSTSTGRPRSGAAGDRDDVAPRDVLRGGWRWAAAAGAVLSLAVAALLLARDARRRSATPGR
jgi:hypothetical protein